MTGNKQLYFSPVGKILAVIFLLVTAVSSLGCNNQPKVSSPEALELIKQAYTACNTKNDKRLADTQSEFDKLANEGKLTENEKESFREILDLAREGNWQKAQDRAFSFAQSQVR